MTRRRDLPEEATEEPRILSPAEEGERALRAMEVSAAREEAGLDPSLADPHNPLRMPGELSSRPRDEDDDDDTERDVARDDER